MDPLVWIGLISGVVALQLVVISCQFRRLRAETASVRRLQLAIALHFVGEQLRRDRSFVQVLRTFRDRPEELDETDRIRARSWARDASRVFSLALAEQEHAGEPLWYVPSMGESPKPGGSNLPTLETLIQMDPEFLALVDALRNR